MQPRYVIGIDLGTTNSALAYVDLKAKQRGQLPEIHAFPVPQLVASGEVADRPLLPSFLYRPGPHELAPGATALPWNKHAPDAVGEFARDHGAKVVGRLVSSAKSWLSHAGVDRSAGLLPWGAPPEIQRISPVAASTRFLKHFVDAWNANITSNENERLEKLPVVLTLPASFDDVARALTVEAAKQAGLLHVTLLEEPQAAFYCWQHLSQRSEIQKLRAGMTCLVIDVGGGTTDLSLISAIEEAGDLRFIRQAVGDHLLLGGDNMDLALARHVESQLPAGKLDATQTSALIHACRRAKEQLLGPQPPASVPVTVVGRGRSVVGGAVTVALKPADVKRIIVDGFFPKVQPGDSPTTPTRTALHEMGLPYVHDAAITRHMSAFLAQHRASSSAPDAVLFNGGVFQPQMLRAHVIEVLRPWYPEKSFPPQVLTTPSLDLAVAYGAAAYGWLKQTGGQLIGGGIARSYYIQIDQGSAADKSLSVLCVMPRHQNEDQEIAITKPEFELKLSEPVAFPLFASTARDDPAGAIISVEPTQLKKLPPLQTILKAGRRGASGPKQIPITIAARTTAIGTLELACVAKEGGHRWKLEFNTRDLVAEDEDEVDSPTISQPGEVITENELAPASRLIEMAFAGEDSDLPRELTKGLEDSLDMPKEEWPISACRRLWTCIADVADNRRRSTSHLARWYNLAGFLLRPGFGHALDRHYVESLWKLLHAAKAGESAPAEPAGADAWIMWRRVAGGLTAAHQNTLFDRLRPSLLGGKGKSQVKPGANELAEMWRAAASLERIEVDRKVNLATVLLKQIRRGEAPTHAFWALTRLGTRELFYGPLNLVVHPETVTAWLDPILQYEPTHESERLAKAFCLAQLARRTGQLALDLDESRRTEIHQYLSREKTPSEWPQMVISVLGRGSMERRDVFGDSLPVGLRLRG